MTIKMISAFIDAATGRVRVIESDITAFRRNRAAFITGTANAMIKRGERGRAMELLERGVKIYPNDALIHAQLGRTYAYMSEAALSPRQIWSSESDSWRMKAVWHMTRASNLKQDDFRFAVNAAYQHELIQQDIRARDLYIRAASIDPLDQHPWVMLGNVNLRLNHKLMARVCFQNAVRIDINNLHAVSRLAELGANPDPLSPIDFTPLGRTSLVVQAPKPG